MIRTSRVPVFLALAALTGACVLSHEHPKGRPAGGGGLDSASSAQLDRLIQDVCDKSVVMLGEEPHHGGGRSVEVKAELVQQLIARCGFNGVYFESGVYEFEDLNRRLAAGTSAPEQVADAIGGLWSRSSAIDPLVSYLYTQAAAGRIRLAGVDPQLGSATSGFIKGAFVDELVGGLDEPRRSECATHIFRFTNWRYDDEHPNDEAEQDRLLVCLREAADAAKPDSALSTLAETAWNAVTQRIAGGGDWDWREREMTRLFRWHQQRSPGASRVIVWAASVHTARTLGAKSRVRPFGNDLQEEYGARLASVAFTALGGAYGCGDSTPIPLAAADSLEARAMAGGTDPLRYLDRPALAALGAVQAWPLSYGNPQPLDWSLLFDDVVVLREEKPLSMDRPATPRFAPPAQR